MHPIESSSQNHAIAKFRSGGFLIRALALCLVVATFGLTSCSTPQKKKATPPPASIQQKLPKPAPMRVSMDSNTRRKPPLLPKTVVNIRDDSSEPLAVNDSGASSEIKHVESTTPKFINNEQTQDFFQGAGDGPAGETVLGSFFDTVFRPANAANQPVSSTSYKVE